MVKPVTHNEVPPYNLYGGLELAPKGTNQDTSFQDTPVPIPNGVNYTPSFQCGVTGRPLPLSNSQLEQAQDRFDVAKAAHEFSLSELKEAIRELERAINVVDAMQLLLEEKQTGLQLIMANYTELLKAQKEDKQTLIQLNTEFDNTAKDLTQSMRQFSSLLNENLDEEKKILTALGTLVDQFLVLADKYDPASVNIFRESIRGLEKSIDEISDTAKRSGMKIHGEKIEALAEPIIANRDSTQSTQTRIEERKPEIEKKKTALDEATKAFDGVKADLAKAEEAVSAARKEVEFAEKQAKKTEAELNAARIELEKIAKKEEARE